MGWTDWVAPIASVATAAIGYSASKKASQAQQNAAQQSIDEQRRALADAQARMQPYSQTGLDAMAQLRSLQGLNGAPAQQAALDAIKASPEFSTLLKSSEDALLANASATGGLRGGNTQRALAELSPAILQSLIGDKFNRLSGLMAAGQNAAGGLGVQGTNTASNIGLSLQQLGAAQAGQQIARANTLNNAIGGLGGWAAYQGGLGRFG